MNTLKKLGGRIQQLRKKKGLTQEQLQDKTGIHTKYISTIESGAKNVTIETLEKIAKGLDVELYELFLFTSEGEPEEGVKKAMEKLMKVADQEELYNCFYIMRKIIVK